MRFSGFVLITKLYSNCRTFLLELYSVNQPDVFSIAFGKCKTISKICSNENSFEDIKINIDIV